MINTEGFDPYFLYFRQIDLFSDLSRNTTSSPSSPTSSNDLFENEDPEVQGNIGSDLEIEGLQDGSTSDVNQTSSPSSPTSSNDLFENEDPEVQGNIGSDLEIEGLQDGSTSDVNQTSSPS
jgi:hypothetical protein